MKALTLLAALWFSLAAAHAEECVGAADCTICMDCTKCAHCSKGGVCGMKLASPPGRRGRNFSWLTEFSLNKYGSKAGINEPAVTRKVQRNRDGQVIEYAVRAAETSILVSRGDRTRSKALEKSGAQADSKLIAQEMDEDFLVHMAWSDVQGFAGTLARFLQWEKAAREANAQPFESLMGTYVDGEVRFAWRDLGTIRRAELSPLGFDATDVTEVLTLLREHLPAAQKEMLALKHQREREAEALKAALQSPPAPPGS